MSMFRSAVYPAIASRSGAKPVRPLLLQNLCSISFQGPAGTQFALFPYARSIAFRKIADTGFSCNAGGTHSSAFDCLPSHGVKDFLEIGINTLIMAPGRRSYEAPIQRVDDALSRLTATLASYKVTESGNGAKMVGPKRPVSSGSSTPSNPDSITESQFDYERDFAHLDPPGLFDLDFDVNTKDLYPNVRNFPLPLPVTRCHW